MSSDIQYNKVLSQEERSKFNLLADEILLDKIAEYLK